MDVGTFRDGFQWYCPLGDIGWWRFARRAAETRRHGPPTSASPRLSGIIASWTWVRSATDSNGIARWVTSVGGDSPAGPGFMPIRYDGVLARSLPQPTRL
jgi:hypothetical protein